MRTIFWLIALFAAMAYGLRAAEPVNIADPKDRELVQQFLKHAAKLPEQITAAYCRKMADNEAEGYTWLILPQVEMSLTAYELTGDGKHIETFIQLLANMRSALTQGPDGYWGWRGKALAGFQDPKAPDRKGDVMISDFRAVEIISRFLRIVSADSGLSAKYAKLRQECLDLMENHFVKKWDARGNYVELGLTGAIYRTEAGLLDVKSHLTQPHNKHSIIIHGLLALYRVTGRDEYMKKAVRLGERFKHCLTLKDGHYEWNYWDPAGAWDVDPNKKAAWKHWIGPEHKGGYYSSTLSQAVLLYQHGVVFDKADMDRFLQTQLTQCWNGDADNPKWFRVDHTAPKQYTQGAYMCEALAPFSAKIADFIFIGARRDERLKNAGHGWQGGPVLNGWLEEKLLILPKAAGGKQIYLMEAAPFLKKPENSGWLKSLAFEVTGAGYAPPKAPADMKAMPPEPGR